MTVTTTSKRGISWAWNNPAAQFSLYQPSVSSKKLSWLFNWEMWVPPSLPSGLEYIPQVRMGNQAEQIDTSLGTLQRERGVVPFFIGFNEPEIESQSNMSVRDAVQLWEKYVLPAKQKFGFQLGAPAISSDAKGKAWLRDFFRELTGADGVDFLVLHWYGRDPTQMIHFLQDMHDTFGKPLWLNEFAFSHMGSGGEATPEEVDAFMCETIPWLDKCDFVERYAYFGAVVDVGDWVGRASNFSEASSIEGKMRLSRVGRTYLQL